MNDKKGYGSLQARNDTNSGVFDLFVFFDDTFFAVAIFVLSPLTMIYKAIMADIQNKHKHNGK